MTDFVISNDLVVLGMSTFTGGQTFDGQAIIDIDNTEALLVRKDGDSGDVLTVNTIDEIVTIGGAMRASGASGHAFGTPATNSVLTIDTTSTANGGGTNAAAVNFFPDYTGASGLTDFIALTTLGGNIQTQAVAETTTNVSTLVVSEPSISIGAGHTVTNAQTLLIDGSPTEGTNNFAIRSTGAAPALFAGQQLSIGKSTLDGFAQFIIRGIFTSDGSSFIASKVDVTGGLIGASGDSELATAMFRNNITTQTAAEVITDVAQVIINDPVITLGAGSSVTNAQSLKINGSPTEGTNNFAIRSIGPAPSLFIGQQFVIGQSAVDVNWQFLLAGNFTTGAAGEAAKLRIEGGLIGAPGTTTGIFGADFNTTITTQTATESIADIAQVRIDEPSIADNLTGDITHASILLLTSSTVLEEGVNNWGIRALGAAPSLFQASQFVLGKTTVDAWNGVQIGGAFTSGGGNAVAAKVRTEGSVVGASGDTTLLSGAWFDVSVATQTATESIGDVSQVRIDEPAITDNLTGGGVITHASTLSITGSPTEGANNWTIRSIGPAPTVFTGLQFVIGRSTIFDRNQIEFAGTFTSGGSSTTAAKFQTGGTLIGAPGDTLDLTNSYFDGNITTQTATESISNISQVRIDEPNITDNLTGTITDAQTLLIVGSPTEGNENWTLRTVGAPAPSLFEGLQFGIGGTALFDYHQVLITGNFTSGGATTFGSKFRVQGQMIGASGDTAFLAGCSFQATLITQTATENIADVSQVRIDEPIITDNLTGDITTAQTLFLSGSPTEGVANYALRSAGAAPSLFAGLQFVIGDFAVDDYHQVLISGSFTSGGASDRAAKLRLEGVLTGAAGDTGTIQGAYFDASITTQTATENIADISQVRIDEPTITDNLTGDITVAHTLFLVGSPTEGESNFSLRSTGSAPTMLQGAQFVIGSGTVPIADFRQILFAGSFTSGGGSDRATKFRIEGILTGASGDTNLLAGSHFDAAIVTQTETESIQEISQVRIDDPTITDNLTGDITTAQTLLLSGSPTEGETNFAIRSTGSAASMFFGQQFFIGTNVLSDVWQVQIRGNYTSGGSSNRAAKFEVEEALIGVSGDTVFLGGASFDASVTTQTAAEVVTDVFQVRIDEPTITVGAGSSITNAQSLLIVAAPTEGVNNYAVRVVTGNVFFGGAQAIFGNGTAALPGIVFEADADSGFYMNSSNDSLLISMEANSIVRFDRAAAQPRVNLSSDCHLTWLSGSAEAGGVQFALLRESPDAGGAPSGDLAIANTNLSVYQERTASTSEYHRTSIRTATETLSSVTGASVSTASIIPAGALVLGVTTDVDVALGTGNGTTGYQVGDGSDVDRWGDITGTSTSTFSDDADFTTTTVDRFSAASAVTITAVGGNFDGTGDIVVVVHFMEIGARKP